MSDKNGFRKYERAVDSYKAVDKRLTNFEEFTVPLKAAALKDQSERCMDCGIAFCHNGCPINNKIPDFNEAVATNKWDEAYKILSSTNNFPEFTGRLCPAPCESACVLGITSDPVSIKTVENHIIEYAFENNLVQATSAPKTGKKIAIVGSGPAGMAAADQLAQAGHSVTLFERNDKIGGLLRYGIPDFKMEKHIIDRRMEVMKASGVEFKTSMNIGVDIAMNDIVDAHDAVLLTCGSTIPRDVKIDGRTLKGIYPAMDYLEQKNRIVAGEKFDADTNIEIEGKNIIVIGGGDTGADCVGTSNRLKANSVTQIELLEKPPVERPNTTPWPLWPDKLRTSSSHLEGCERKWALNSKEFIGDKDGNLTGLKVVELEWKEKEDGNGKTFTELSETVKVIPCDIVFLAIGFVHPDKAGPISELGLELDGRGNVKANGYKTSHDKVFAAGDMRMGQSLIVWAIAEGRKAAIAINKALEVEPVLRNSAASFYTV